MKHVNLDSHDEAVKRFVLSLPADPSGSVLELDGKAIAHVLPIPAPAGADDWDGAKDARRCDLIDREIAGTLTPDEAAEPRVLQEAMLRHRRKVAPLPLDEARRLHRDLLTQADSEPTS